MSAAVSRRTGSLNIRDAPELSFGQRSGQGKKLQLQRNCFSMHEEDAHPQVTEHWGIQAKVADIGSIFPSFDAALVQTICADAPTSQQAVETLLALARSESSVTGEVIAPSISIRPGRDSSQDHEDFPSLMDADGWELVTMLSLENATSADLGQAWRDLAKAAVGFPSPVTRRTEVMVPKRGDRLTDNAEDDADVLQFETDYEIRQRLGKQRVEKRFKFPRKLRDSHREEMAGTVVAAAVS